MNRTRIASYCAALLALVGIVFPSSDNGTISPELGLALRVLLLLLAAALFIAAPSWTRLINNNLYICPALLLFTFFSPLQTHAYGLLTLYATVSLVLSTNFSIIPRVGLLTCVWQFVNCASLIVAAAIACDVDVVKTFIVANYSAFYPWLVEATVNAGKPILTFGSHSIAGFFFAMFCVLNCIHARAKSALLPVVAAGLHLVACALLRSVTGYTVLLVFLIAGIFIAKRSWRGPLLIGVGLILLGTLLLGQGMLVELLASTMEVFSSESNGFLGRYSSTGRAGPMLDYIWKNPFTPSGVGYTEDVWVGDTGFLEYWFRGSVVLLVLMYRGLWLTVRGTVLGCSTAICIFGLFLMFELGYTALVYPRMLGFMPLFFIVFRTWHIRPPQVRQQCSP